MRVLVLTVGSRGDVQPYVALGLGLQTAGHEVMICTHERFEPFVTEHGLSHGYMNDDLVDLLDSEEGRELIERLTNVVATVRTMIVMARQVGPIQRRMFRDGWATTEQFDPDLIVYHPKVYCAPQFADKLDVPIVMALLMPMYVPTGEFPCMGFPRIPLGGGYNRLTYRFVQAMAALGGRKYIVEWRRKQGMGRRPRAGIVRMRDGRLIPVVHGYSRHVEPVPTDWPPSATASGYWILDRPATWTPPDDLVRFLDAGPAPVYVGFGSMAASRPERVTKIVLDAIERAGVRCVLATGWGGLDPGSVPETVHVLEAAPHDWLFPRMAAVVHHGGAGTTAAGLRAGRPTVVCSFFGDQPYWGRRVYELGAGPPPLRQRSMTAEELAHAIGIAATDDGIRANAERLGVAIAQEDGVATAVATIESQMRRA